MYSTVLVPGCCLGNHGLAAAGRPVQQHPLRRHHQGGVGEEAALLYGQNDGLSQLGHKGLQAGNVRKGDADGGGIHQLAGDEHLVLGELHVAGDAEGGEQLAGALLRRQLLFAGRVQRVNHQLKF